MNERMSDAEMDMHRCHIMAVAEYGLEGNAYEELMAELDRARKSEEALLARVAALEAERAGETGTPKADGRYWCEARAARYQWREIFRWHRGRWNEQRLSSWEAAPDVITIIRHWRLPGETYEVRNANPG